MSCKFVKVNNEWLPGVNNVATRWQYIEDKAWTLGSSAGVTQRVTRAGKYAVHEVRLGKVPGTDFMALVDNLASMTTATVQIMNRAPQEMLVTLTQTPYRPEFRRSGSDVNAGEVTVQFQELIATDGGVV